jgi:hypothetical protein
VLFPLYQPPPPRRSRMTAEYAQGSFFGAGCRFFWGGWGGGGRCSGVAIGIHNVVGVEAQHACGPIAFLSGVHFSLTVVIINHATHR